MAGTVAVSQIQFDNGNGTVILAAPLSNASYTFTLPAANTGAILLANNTMGLAAGSAGAPSVTANTDTASGMFFPAANTIAFSTASTERIRIDSGGALASTANIDFKVGASYNTAFRIETTGRLYNSVDSDVGTNYRSTLYPGTLCRAWVNFNGTGVVAIRASFNVSSITDHGTGDYTVNFTTAMPDINYTVNVNYSPIYGTYYNAGARLFGTGALVESAPVVGSFRFVTHFITGNEQDPKYVSVAIFR